MRRRMLLSAVHRAVITHADLHYEGSCTIDTDLMDAAAILPGQEVHIWNVTRGTRLSTYAMSGPPGSGVICINGAAAHGNKPGDLVVIATFGEMGNEEARRLEPKLVHVDQHNRLLAHPQVPSSQLSPRPLESDSGTR